MWAWKDGFQVWVEAPFWRMSHMAVVKSPAAIAATAACSGHSNRRANNDVSMQHGEATKHSNYQCRRNVRQ
jgi:anti-sigma-K factor RskA